MNSNLINILSEQARSSIPKDVYGPADWVVQYNERLAELILNQCIEICEQGTATQATSSGAALMIKQHFDL